MEINNFSQSSSLIYQELAQKRAESSNIDKNELEKSTQESYDKVNISDNKYNKENDNLSSLEDELSSSSAQISRTANLNKLLLQSQEFNQGGSNEN